MQCFCFNKIRDNNGRIIGYQFRDGKGNEFRLDAEATKANIMNGSIEPTNLKLTSNGRIISCKVEVENTHEELSARLRRYLVGISTNCNIAVSTLNFLIRIKTEINNISFNYYREINKIKSKLLAKFHLF